LLAAVVPGEFVSLLPEVTMGSEVVKVIHNGEVNYMVGFEATASGQSGTDGQSSTGNYELVMSVDADQDGVLDSVDICPGFDDKVDSDADGIPDGCDADVDGDGVHDARDRCLETTLGEPVNARGCSVVQSCPCERPWTNHRKYMSCVRRKTRTLVQVGVMTELERRKRVFTADQSSCGDKE
jgi:hypothetical protein